MTLEKGSVLGDYEILSPLGAGGMGEVYRAKDRRLGRDVAIKVLPVGLADSPQRLARFEREARTLAGLNHPNLATLYGFETAAARGAAAATPILIMELVDGETLAERIARGAVPVGEALPMFRQIAEGLEIAHESGVLHRDLKPANVKITRQGRVKILDFGLAKVLENDDGVAEQDATVTAGATVEGAILGTPAYMSPEQARGQTLDQRSDVWSFGCMLFEALTARSPFGGETVTDTLAHIVDREPDWEALPADTPVAIRTLLRRCLEKDRHRRLPHIGAARLDLADSVSDGPRPPESPQAPPAARRGKALAVAAAVAAVVALAVAWWAMRGTEEPSSAEVRRLSIDPSTSESWVVSTHDPDVAISPDGEHIAYIGRRGDDNHLVVRRLDEFEGVSLGVFGGLVRHPFFSPDGRWIGFVDGNVLKRTAVDGSATATVCVLPDYLSGAAWGEDGTIILGTLNEGLFRVSSTGGEPVAVETVATQEGRSARWPEALPGGGAVLFASQLREGDPQVRLASLDGPEETLIVENATFPRYSPTGHLLYVTNGALWGVRFDLDTLETVGEPKPVVNGIMIKGPQLTGMGAADIAISDNGTLVYRPSGPDAGGASSLVWVDRQGREEPLDFAPRNFGRMRLSPDGSRLAIEITDPNLTNIDIWAADLETGALTQLTFDPAPDTFPVWTPDGKRILWVSKRDDEEVILAKAADGSGTPQRLSDAKPIQLYFVTPDGRDAVYLSYLARATLGAAAVAVDGAQRERPMELEGGPVASLSADGRWYAYSSPETGDFEVYVQPFPNPEHTKWRITNGGGRDPAWSADGQELFYQSDTGTWAVSVTTDPTFAFSSPTRLFDSPYLDSLGRWYDVAPDGRFLMIKPGWLSAGREAPMRVVLNWFDELERLLPAN